MIDLTTSYRRLIPPAQYSAVVDRARDPKKYSSREWNDHYDRTFVFREGMEDGSVSFPTTGLGDKLGGVTTTGMLLT